MIPFNKPYLSGRELEYIHQSIESGKISGDGMFSKKCHEFFEKKYGFRKVLLTTSCTDALEMTAILADFQPDDEVIMPSYTFVSTSNAFVLRGAKIVFCDSRTDNPNIDENLIEELITPRTKAIVCVHYGGIACNMDAICKIARKHDILLIEDAAQAIDSYYKGKPLGSFGQMAAFSFHETKNVISGEGGMIAINDEKYLHRSEIIREKGTNRSAFFRGEVDKYGWVDYGSSFLPSDMIAAFLYGQLENLTEIQKKRIEIWERYKNGLEKLVEDGCISFPALPDYATNNAHLFAIICRNLEERSGLISFLKSNEINAVFHYLSLHQSPFYKDKHDGRALPNCSRYADCLVRLPLFYELTIESQNFIIDKIKEFYGY